MRSDERMVLRVLLQLGVVDAEAIARKLVVSPGYVRKVCDSLAQNGYLSQNTEGKYQLTSKGERHDPRNYIPAPRKTETHYRYARGPVSIIAPVTSFKYGPIMQATRGWRRW